MQKLSVQRWNGWNFNNIFQFEEVEEILKKDEIGKFWYQTMNSTQFDYRKEFRFYYKKTTNKQNYLQDHQWLQ